MVERSEQVTSDIYGCDECECEIPELPNEPNRLELTVFDKNDESRHLHFCSWRCVLTHIPKVECTYFIDLPFLYYDIKEGKNRLAKELIDIIKTTLTRPQ